MDHTEDIIIRIFKDEDRDAVRRISCETAFLGEPHTHFLDDEELLADVLTRYYTDYEAGSCFVAVNAGNVVGYVIGSTDTARMRKIVSQKIIPQVVGAAFRKRIFSNHKTNRFIRNMTGSLLKGEFFIPDFSRLYPATLHINISGDFRRKAVGRRLIEYYQEFLLRKNVSGVRFGTMSESAKAFFLKMDFKLLFSGRRSYLRYYFGKDIPYYILGKRFFHEENRPERI